MSEPIEDVFIRIFDKIKNSIIGDRGDATSQLDLRIEAARIAQDLARFEGSREMFDKEKEDA